MKDKKVIKSTPSSFSSEDFSHEASIKALEGTLWTARFPEKFEEQFRGSSTVVSLLLVQEPGDAVGDSEERNHRLLSLPYFMEENEDDKPYYVYTFRLPLEHDYNLSLSKYHTPQGTGVRLNFTLASFSSVVKQYRIRVLHSSLHPMMERFRSFVRKAAFRRNKIDKAYNDVISMNKQLEDEVYPL